jgi:hypothetical protein
MSPNQKTAVILGSSVVVGFLGDVMIYSLSESKGKKFSVHMPKGWALVNLLALGVATGLVVDFAIRKIQDAVSSKQEKELDKLVEKEKQKIDSGALAGKQPSEILWVKA